MASVLGYERSTPAMPRGRETAAYHGVWYDARRVGGAMVALQAARWLSAWINRRSTPSTRSGALLGDFAGEIGRGLVAGLVGTAAITLAAAAEQQIRSRLQGGATKEPGPSGVFPVLIAPWLYSADAVGTILGGVTPADDSAKRRLALAAHLSYGTSWGASLGVLELAGIRGPGAMGTLLGAILGAEMLVMPKLGFFPPVSQWGSEAVFSSTYQHALYAIAAGLTFDWLHR